MPLAPGTKLGPYEIQSAVGAGGMGEVYRARDPRLERTVAIKVLPTHLNLNPELRARFEREAKAISGLQHPNICVLYDVGSQGDIDFLVMEYLEGETLYARLARKPLTPDETLKIAAEVADALVKAHRSGIVHRDLKPGNVMLTKGGAKLMDFGLAKPLGLATGPQSNSAHVSSMATMAATIAGWLIAAALGVLVMIYAGRLTSAQQPVHTSIEPPAGFDFFSVQDGAPVLSPDGQQVAFLVAKKGTSFTPGG